MKKAGWVVVSNFTTRKEYEEFYKKSGRDPEDYHIDDFNEIEISVVRESDKHGQKSYGWGGNSKIILFDSPAYDVTQIDMDWYEKVAAVFCKTLNREGL